MVEMAGAAAGAERRTTEVCNLDVCNGRSQDVSGREYRQATYMITSQIPPDSSPDMAITFNQLFNHLLLGEMETAHGVNHFHMIKR